MRCGEFEIEISSVSSIVCYESESQRNGFLDRKGKAREQRVHECISAFYQTGRVFF